jgi:hypothetical protein
MSHDVLYKQQGMPAKICIALDIYFISLYVTSITSLVLAVTVNRPKVSQLMKKVFAVDNAFAFKSCLQKSEAVSNSSAGGSDSCAWIPTLQQCLQFLRRYFMRMCCNNIRKFYLSFRHISDNPICECSSNVEVKICKYKQIAKRS